MELEPIVADFKEIQANSMALDCTGRYVLLSGKRVLGIVNLDNPTSIAKSLKRQSKWEISACQWNPNLSHKHYFVTAASQRADLWSWHNGKGAPISSLKSHTRNISDLEWSPKLPNMIATCSVDTYTYVWDIRESRKPSIVLPSSAEAHQVKWNKINQNLLAITNDGNIRIWDIRQNGAVEYIAAHLSKILGLDWSPDNENRLATASQDTTVKIWDYLQPKKETQLIRTPAPVWRARFTPFGQGLVTVLLPHLRRIDNSILLFNLDKETDSPVHTFGSFSDLVLEFEWRLGKGLNYELVTWCKDQSLRILNVDPQIQRSCGAELTSSTGYDTEDMTIYSSSTGQDDAFAMATPPEIINTPKEFGLMMATPPQQIYLTRSLEDKLSPQQPQTLNQEFSLAYLDLPNLNVDQLDAVGRKCSVTAYSGMSRKYSVKLTMTFPLMYPYNITPDFQFGSPTNLNEHLKTKLIKLLRDTANTHVKNNRSCLEPCLRQLVTTLDSFQFEDRNTPDSETSYMGTYNLNFASRAPSYIQSSQEYQTIQDKSIPFPRTSGARFCGAGSLVCFTRPGHLKHRLAGMITPRSLDALMSYTQRVRTPGHQTAPGFVTALFGSSSIGYGRSPPADSAHALTSFYQGSNKARVRNRPHRTLNIEHSRRSSKDEKDISGKKSPKKSAGPVVIYDISNMLPIHKQLAEAYVLDKTNLHETCHKNAQAAATMGRKDLIQLWSLAGEQVKALSMSSPTNADEGPPWAFHPFGRKMIESYLDHYAAIYDIQTLAMLTCVFGPILKDDKKELLNLVNNVTEDCQQAMSASESDAQLISFPYIDAPLNGNFVASTVKRSSSFSEIEKYLDTDLVISRDNETEKHQFNKWLLDPLRVNEYDTYKKVYSDILYHWGLYNKRAEILKFLTVSPEPHTGIEFKTTCYHCGAEMRSSQCGMCKNFGFQCAICRISVRGSSSFCLACGHGGHSTHMFDWFRNHDICPTGCGCRCLENNPMN